MNFAGQQSPDLAQQVHVPGRAERDPDREGRGVLPADERAAATRARRAVADFQGGDVQPWNGNGAPEVGAGQQRDLLFQRHLVEEFFYPLMRALLSGCCSLHLSYFLSCPTRLTRAS